MGQDFNDIATERGLAAVKEKVAPVIDAAKGVPYRPFTVKPDGVYETKTNHKTKESWEIWFCSPIAPVALARDEQDGAYTVLLEMKNPYGMKKQIQIAQEEIFTSGGQEALRRFVNAGGRFGAQASEKTGFPVLMKAFYRHINELGQILLAGQTGWLQQSEKYRFVLPGRTIGSSESAEKIILKDQGTGAPKFEVKGTLADYQQHVLRYCKGNSRLVFAVCLAMAAVLLRLRGARGSGVYFFGPSSIGKTTLLEMATSVMGLVDNLVKTFNATANSLEGTARNFNDCLLALDELGQAAAEQLGRIIYTLIDGIQRGRADMHGNARELVNWLVLVLACGEIDLEAFLASAGQSLKAGQDTRLPSIPADAEQGLGVFETIHGFESPSAFADYLKAACRKYHGSLFQAFLEKLTSELNDPEQRDIRLKWIAEQEQEFIKSVIPPKASGQVVRASQRFALAAVAGELATSYGLTGWPEGEAILSATVCFKAWLDRRGTYGDSETQNLINQVNGFFETFGDSRFQKLEAKSGRDIPRRAGFRRSLGDSLDGDSSGFEYLVLPDPWRKEVVAGFDNRWAVKTLIKQGIIQPSPNGETTWSKRLPGLGTKRVYVLRFSDDETPSAPPEPPPEIDSNFEVPF